MTKPRLIALCGYARSGKDTLAEHLPGYSRVAFADELKRRLAWAAGIALEDIEKCKEACRPAMVELGRLGRRFYPSIWIMPVAQLAALYPNRSLIVTDTRYQNEARWVKSQGGIVVHVVRDGYGPANEEEAATVPEAAALADVTVRTVEGDYMASAEQLMAWMEAHHDAK